MAFNIDKQKTRKKPANKKTQKSAFLKVNFIYI